MKQLQILIKPASSDCNLNCSYCFYKDISAHRRISSCGKMGKNLAELLVKKALEEAEDSCTFAFQGGEPTLLGLEFYRYFTACVKKWKKKRTEVFYILQTNGLLLDEEWIQFLKENGFLTGISIDGTRLLHDRNRCDSRGRGSYQQAFRAAEKMRQAGIPFHVLCVLTKQNARKAASIYRSFVKTGFCYQQYIPCLDSLDEEQGKSPWSLDAGEYADAVCTLFDLWFEDIMRGHMVYVREFDNWVQMLQGFPPEACTLRGQCSMQYVIEANGDIFPCDFYVLDSFRVGNISDRDFRFGDERHETLSFLTEGRKRGEKCPSCKWYPLCRGGCRRDCRVTPSGSFENRFCQAYRRIFPYCIERLELLASIR